jgi:amino acid transporter
VATIASTQLSAAEASVKAHSAVLRKELGIADLVMAQILLVMVPEFFGTAAKAGASQVVFWLLGIALFFIPLTLVVIHLNRLMPLEGGLYEWARLAFNDQIGFLVAWNLWLFIAVYFACIGLVTVTYIAYAIGPEAGWMVSNKWIVLGAAVGLIGTLMLVARQGLRVGKWVGNVGSALTVLTIGLLALMPFVSVWRGTLTGYHPLHLEIPPLNLFSLSVFSKMTFGALVGFEYVAIFAGECRHPVRNITRATLIAAPINALLYIFGTSAILAFISPDAVDLIAPVPQALSRGFQSFTFARIVIPLSILMLLTNYVATFSVQFSGNARLPMVAGWDHLLPEWFTRLHAKHKTPVNSILFAGVVTLAASAAVLIGVGSQEAFELLQMWSFAFYGLTYLALFAIPLLARKDRGIRPALWLRVAAASGFLVTLLFVLLSAFPIIPVVSQSTYTAKTVAVLFVANALGVLLYRLARRKQALAPQ